MSFMEIFRNILKLKQNGRNKKKINQYERLKSVNVEINGSGTFPRRKSSQNPAKNGHHRSNSLRESPSNNNRSTWSLRRVGSLGSQLISKKKDNYDIVVENLERSTEISDNNAIVTFCVYTELYQQLNGNGQLALPENQHPKFIKFSQNRNVALFLSKACHECQQPGSMCIIHSISNQLFRQIRRYFEQNVQSERLDRLEFYLDGTNHCLESISDDTFAQFSKFLGPSLRQIRFLTKYENFVEFGIRFNHGLTATFLSLLHVHSESYKNLVEFEVVLADSSAIRFFSLFAKSLGPQLEKLRIKLYPNITDYDFPTMIIDVIRDGISGMKNLKSLFIELLPIRLPGVNKADLAWVLQEISKSSLTEKVEEFGLGIDISHVKCSNLDLISCLNAYAVAGTLSLTVYANRKQLALTDFNLDFSPLATNENLRELTIDCSSLSNSDLCQLAKSCPRLTRLNIGCDDRIDQIALNALAKHLSNLKTLIIGEASSYQMDSKQGLYLDNEALCILLGDAPKRLQSLRTVKLSNCRIELDDPRTSLVDHLRSWALSKPDETFWLILENNRFALLDECEFKIMNDIPANLELKWIHKRVKQETSL